MKKRLSLLILFCLLLSLTSFASGVKLTPKMKIKLRSHVAAIRKWVADPVIVDAVKAQNARKLSLEEIKKRDAAWIKIMKARGTASAFMESLLNHPTGAWLREKNEQAKGCYPEAFLCDNQGANVAVSALTSDYWQGDEGKWADSFNGAKVTIGEPEYDESTDSILVQVSVPVMDGDDVIGVLVVGVKLMAVM